MKLIGVDELSDKSRQYFIIDTRRQQEYETGHIVGARVLPVDYWLKEGDEYGSTRGTKMVFEKDFISLLYKMGVSDATEIVVYDDNHGRGSARFWIVAQQYGIENVGILDGGWHNYVSNGLPVERGVCKYQPSGYPSQIRTREYIISLSDLLTQYPLLKIIDARSDEEWSGKDLHGNPRGGHLPGAIHLNWEELISHDTAHTFVDREEIVSKASALGLKRDDAIVVYCQAGVRAAFVAVALIYAGFENVKVYDGSMCEWSRDPSLQLEKEIMKILINDQEVEFAEPMTVSQAVRDFVVTGEEIIMHNGKYLSRENCDKCIIADGDKIDIIKFLAGG